MSQPQNDKPAKGEQSLQANDRREFIRQSLGVAPLMLTLGGRGNGVGASVHGTLWSSLGTTSQHKGDWWRFKSDRWRWTKSSGDHWHERNEPAARDWKEDDWRPGDKVGTERKDWDWDKPEDRRRPELGAESKPRDWDWKRRSENPTNPTTEPSHDWRHDGEWKRSEGLPPLASDSNRKKD